MKMNDGMQMLTRRNRGMIAVLLAGTAALSAGCEKQEPLQQTETAYMRYGETELITELITELYEAETETDFFGEVLLRSIWEIMPDETRLWAAAFDVEEVEQVIYTTYMEDAPDTYEITDPARITAIFEAISGMQAGGAVSMPARQGDVFVFRMKDGTEQEFVFSLMCILTGGQAYETDHSDPLWELTGDIIFGEQLPEAEY